MARPAILLGLLALVASTSRARAAVVVEETPGAVALSNALARARVELTNGAVDVTWDGVAVGPLLPAAESGRATLRPSGGTPSYVVEDVADARGTGKSVTVRWPDAATGDVLELVLALRDGRPETTLVLAVTLSVAERVLAYSLSGPDTALDALGAGTRVLSEVAENGTEPPVAERAFATRGEGLAAVYSPALDRTLVLGALTAAERVTVSVAPPAGVRIDAQGPRRTLAPGERTASDVLALALAPGPASALESYADARAAIRGIPPPATPPWGWISWYAVLSPDEALLAVAADALAGVDGGRGEAILVMDDGWQDRLGDWEANARFPSGMAALARGAHDRGIRAGLWIAPFGVAEGSRVALDHPDWLVPAPGGGPHVVEDRPEWGGRIFLLDPSVPGVVPFLAALVDRIASVWDFDAVKMDFLGWGLVPDALARPGSDPRAAYRSALLAMRAAAPQATILLSNVPLAFADGCGDVVRTGPDAQFDAGSHARAYRASAKRAWANGASFAADPDVLMVRPGLGDPEARRRATFQAMAGGPVFLGDAFFWDPPGAVAIAERLLPPHPYRGRALDLFAEDGLPGRWELPLPRGLAMSAALSSSGFTRESVLPLASGAPAFVARAVHDVWGDRYLGVIASPLPLAVAPADAALLATAPDDDRPRVLATSAHLVGGAVNVTSEAWSPPELTVALRGKPATALRLVLRSPGDLAPGTPTQGVIAPRADGLHDWSLALDATGQALASLSFGPRVPDPPPPAGRPALTPPPGVRVVREEEIASSADLDALLADAASGTFVVVLPPPDPAPAPARLPLAPWAEMRAPGTTTTAPAGSLAAALVQALGLPAEDRSSVLLALRAGVDPVPLASGFRLARATHAVLGSGRGALVRLGRLPDAAVASAVAALGDPAVAGEVRRLLAEVSALRALAREGTRLDGPWRFAIDPAGAGDALGYAQPGFDDSAWETIPVPAYWEDAGHAGYDGIAWYRRRVPLPRRWEGLDLVLRMGNADDEDTTTVGGIPVGRTTSSYAVRRYPVPAAAVAGGEAAIAVRVTDYGAGGGLPRSLRLAADPAAIEARIAGGGELVGFLEAGALRSSPGDLLATKEGTGLRVTVSGGAPPFTLTRGSFPRLAGGGAPLAPSGEDRSFRDDPAGSAAYGLAP